jgi:hypothetical protein
MLGSEMNANTGEAKGPREVPLWLFPIYFPLFLIVVALSYPYTAIMTRYIRYKERRFIRELESANRVMDWPLFAKALEQKRGSLIEEWFSTKGPVRYWWVDDNIPATTPHAWTGDGFGTQS